VNQEQHEAFVGEENARSRMILILSNAKSSPYEIHDAVETYRAAVLNRLAGRFAAHRLEDNGTEYHLGNRDTVDSLTTFTRAIAIKRSYRP
jgi:hypothetical protein